MKPLLQLNLRSDGEKTEEVNPPRPDREEPEPRPVGARVNRLAKKAAHRAGSEFGRNSSGIFSK